jgi:hypothetical protein
MKELKKSILSLKTLGGMFSLLKDAQELQMDDEQILERSLERIKLFTYSIN